MREPKYSERWLFRMPKGVRLRNFSIYSQGRPPPFGTRIASLRSDPPYCTSLAGYIEKSMSSIAVPIKIKFLF